ncbi:hypothetical protein EYZ11_009454 [Aspergillus tanneri]|uniref:ABM domain-containing protein n=1 Tax=Aspergillus tanneri TaxID=1220188 RepID=A0A4S3J7U7_9EURO|nr:uncharacterized protein ATNIH1004_000802 [Aspergillus tanneri]KAA8651903.1 hypothetical protein ATNIH1004_000802 [Aspergillus tanneri]THC91069.1 hypothetical protein EYZ11_009454 [Aspergillus tanneri]
MPGEIYNIVKLVPQPGKFDQVVEAFKTLVQYIEGEEPNTQIYFAVQPNNSKELVFVEKYKDQDSLKAHVSSVAFKQFSKTIGGSLAAPPEIKTAGLIGGFDGRSKL